LACSVAIIGTSDSPKVRSGSNDEDKFHGAHACSSWPDSKLSRI
jgi:hypothetical protein